MQKPNTGPVRLGLIVHELQLSTEHENITCSVFDFRQFSLLHFLATSSFGEHETLSCLAFNMCFCNILSDYYHCIHLSCFGDLWMIPADGFCLMMVVDKTWGFEVTILIHVINLNKKLRHATGVVRN